MHVLLTRPLADANSMAQRLRKAGHQVTIAPVIEIATRQNIPEILQCDGVIATSARAFAGVGKAGPENNWKQSKLFCVGEQTAAAALRCGFAPAQFTASTTRELPAAIVRIVPAPAQLIYLAGKDRKPFLETELPAAGYALHVIAVYEAQAVKAMEASTIALLQAGCIDAVMHFSRRSAEIFVQLVAAAGMVDSAATCRHICISADTSAGLATLAGASVEIAASPDADAVLERLRTGTN